MSEGVESLYTKYLAVLSHLRELPASPARDSAIARLEESAFWASCNLTGQRSGIEYVAPVKAERAHKRTS